MDAAEKKEERSKVTFDGRMQYFHTLGKIMEDIRETNIYADSQTQLKQLSLMYDMVQFVLPTNRKDEIKKDFGKIKRRLQQTRSTIIPIHVREYYKNKVEEDISILRTNIFDEAKELLTAVKKGEDPFDLDDFSRGSDQ